MRKLGSRVLWCMVIAGVVWCGSLLSDKQMLEEGLIRLHVVANSDSQEDQAVKLQVRDAVLRCIQEDLADVADIGQAKSYIQENLPKIQSVANAALRSAGIDQEAVVSFCKETFDIRHYDTFSLPSGIYESLRVTIGEGAGHNWWCIAFPSLCLPAATKDFEAAAAGAGFSDTLTGSLSERGHYEVRFYCLDLLGKVENYFFGKE